MRLAPLALLLLLAACATPEQPAAVAPIVPPAAPAPQIAIPDNPPPQDCVPYARQVSGIKLFGDAWTWWDGALAAHLERGGHSLVTFGVEGWAPALQGLVYNPMADAWSLAPDTDVNYFAAAAKPA